jgi:hypothetical protein
MELKTSALCVNTRVQDVLVVSCSFEKSCGLMDC